MEGDPDILLANSRLDSATCAPKEACLQDLTTSESCRQIV